MNCKYLKLKLNRKLECKLLKKEIKISTCGDCPFKAIKEAQIRTKLKPRSNALATLERKRTSLFTSDLGYCYLCGGKKKRDSLHEIYSGRNRKNSMKYGLVLPLCNDCHRKMHRDVVMQLEYKRKGQNLFNKTYPDLNFVEIFKKNYIE